MSRSSDLTLLHAAFRAKVEGVIAALKSKGVPMEVFEAFRSAKRQAELFAQGPNVTRARPWTSLHQYGLAVDFALKIDGRWSWDKSPHWKTLHDIAKPFGLVPLSFEMAHLQPHDVVMSELRVGRFPADGGKAWADNLRAAVIACPVGAPPVDKLALFT